MECVPTGVQGSLFVDDFAIYCRASTAVEACRKIQLAINNATKWADSMGFKFSPNKTKAIRFTRKRKIEEVPTLFLKESILPYEEEVKFLGVIFDKKLTFGPHINDLANRVRRSLNILKVVSHFDWGADRKTLLRLYTSLCLSKLDYACQIYGSACKTNLEKLDVVHNLGLRICTGAFRTSPVASLYVDSGIPPLSIRRKELSLRYLTKSLTSKANPNYKYIKRPTDYAPNKPCLPKPLEIRYKNESSQIGVLSSEIGEFSYPKTPPWCKPPIKICTGAEGKKNTSIEIIKTKFLHHASTHTGRSIYTDGAKTSNGVGCALVAGGDVIRRKLPSSSSIFTAEVYAVLLSLKYIFNIGKYGDNFTIFCDSKSVLLSLKQFMPSHHMVREAQDLLGNLQTSKCIQVDLCWVPGHVGVRGNEKADRAAKEAIRLNSTTSIPIPFNDFKEIIHFYVIREWQATWNNVAGNFKLKEIHPLIKRWQSSDLSDRRSGIVLTRLRIGHTHITHKFLLESGERRQTPQCVDCQVDLTVKHFLIECPSFTQERRESSLSGLSLSDVLGDDSDVFNLMKFLRKIGIFYKI